MTVKTDAQLTSDANVIKSETTPAANTALRVGQFLLDLVDSKIAKIAGSNSPVSAATTTALPTNTRSTNTLTASANGAITSASLDGVTPFVGMRILVKNEATQANNGIYTLTQIGTAGTPWIMDRATDLDTSAEFISGNLYQALAGGAVNGGRYFVLSVPGGFVLNTSAVTFVVYQANGIFSVKDLGAIGDGTTDDTTAINNARAAAVVYAAANGGAEVYFPPGKYRTTATITLSGATGVVFRGAGRRSSFIQPEQNTDVFSISGNCDGCGIQDLAIERVSGNWPSSGSAVLFDTTARCFARNLNISKGNVGIFTTKSTDVEIEQIKMTQMFGFRGIDVEGQPGSVSDRVNINKITCRNPFGATPVRKGTWTTGVAYTAGDVVFSNSSFWQAQNSATAGATAPILAAGSVVTAHTTNVSDGAVNWRYLGAIIDWLFVYDYATNVDINNIYTLGGDFGFLMTGTGDNSSVIRGSNWNINQPWNHGCNFDRGHDVEVHNVRVNQCLDNNGIGVSGTFSGNLRLRGGFIQQCRNSGILLNGSSDLHVSGFTVANNSQSGANNASGIATGASVTNFSIEDCRSYGANQAFGIAVGVTCDDYAVVGNDVTSNISALAGLLDGSANTATKRVVRNNVGDDSDCASKYLTAQNTSIGSTQIHNVTSLPKGIYLFTYYIAVTTVGSAGTVGCNGSWTDDNSGKSFTGATINLNGANFKSESVVVEVGTSGVINFSTTVAGNVGGQYSVRVAIQRLNNILG